MRTLLDNKLKRVILSSTVHPRTDYVEANADVFEFSLDEEDMAALDALDEGGKGSVSWNPVDVA